MTGNKEVKFTVRLPSGEMAEIRGSNMKEALSKLMDAYGRENLAFRFNIDHGGLRYTYNPLTKDWLVQEIVSTIPFDRRVH